MSRLPPLRASWTVLLSVSLLSASNAGCGKSSSHATSPPTTREVSATVVGPNGARIVGETVLADRIDAPAYDYSKTDTAGVAHFALVNGVWCLHMAYSMPPYREGWVAGAVGRVAPKLLHVHQIRGVRGVDTVLFRLVARPYTVTRGKVLLAGQSEHRGTELTVSGLREYLYTNDDGSYEMYTLPLGTWQGFAEHAGFRSKHFDIVVASSGDTINAPTVTLEPDRDAIPGR